MCSSKLFFFRQSSLNETRMKEQTRTRERERIEVIFIGYVTAGKRYIHACARRGIPECTRKSATNRFSKLSPPQVRCNSTIPVQLPTVLGDFAIFFPPLSFFPVSKTVWFRWSMMRNETSISSTEERNARRRKRKLRRERRISSHETSR